MDLSWNPDQLRYRERLVEFLRDTLPPNWPDIYRRGPASRELSDFCLEYCPLLSKVGFLVPHWPKQYGGNDAAAWEHFILGEEFWAIGEPRGGQYMNVNWIGPTLMRFGTEEQKLRYIPEMAAGKVLWCQGFSEPSSGSDLASLRTRAELRDGNYVINGQKIWTSYAGSAHHCFLLARTGEAGKKGITIFLLSTSTPGITVRPIPNMVGEGDFHEIFFDNVMVPPTAILGSPGTAWPLITFALANERVGIARYEFARRSLNHMVAKLKELGEFKDPAVRQAASHALAACEAARLHVYRIVDERARGVPPSPISSLARWAVVSADNAVANFALNYLPDAFSGDMDPIVVAQHERAISAGIAAGAAEIQLNIAAIQYLNLPREVRK